ncbi:MAG: AbiH family protein [Flavobacterium sp.]|uniref:AbiH family protein n=1 Tax=Flavobacterium sp. TaxID=239 RepID=UPI003265367C
MNRLVIIGNGFDLAHGLPTKYSDFIDDYWKLLTNSDHNDEFVSFENIGSNYNFDKIESLVGLANFIKQLDDKIIFSNAEIYREFGNNYLTGKYPREHILVYKNQFFRLINQKSIQNWVDIENEYYRLLKSIVNLKPTNALVDLAEFEILKKEQIEKLNLEFDQVKNRLEKYLNEKVVAGYKLDFTKDQNINWIKIYDVLKPISLFSNQNNIFREFLKAEDVKEIEEHFNKERKEELVNNLYFLNFNYTPIASIYSDLLNKDDRIESKINSIHGSLENVLENKLNFGFGDEMDEDYKVIENLNDNEYLKNFKSFQYLQNSNYSDLLRFIDSEKFQIYVMGHSCGLSDRTLLNTVFEHNNCRSIKVFYHEKKDVNDITVGDNYTEIVQNISRHFNKKELMREKIVNKTLCQPLPQIQLPKK